VSSELPDGCGHGHVLIAIATYKRPDLLESLLDSVEAQAVALGAHILVVDNDIDRSAQAVCGSRSGVVQYVPEPKPGIAAARNRALRECDRYEYVCFVDDDERAASGWLARLLTCVIDYDADVVSGPVLARFPEGVPGWIVDGGFFECPRRPTGAEVLLPATNNALVRVSAIKRLDSPWFDERFSMTGGSDNEFFWRMRSSGCTSVWCDEAEVSELVDRRRMNVRWICRRGMRHGNVLARLRLREVSRLRVAAEGIARMGYGFVRALVVWMQARRPTAREISTLLRGIGMVQTAFGSTIKEYRR